MAFKGVLLEGLEVWLLLVALGRSISFGQATASALAALLVVIFAGMALRAPLTWCATSPAVQGARMPQASIVS